VRVNAKPAILLRKIAHGVQGRAQRITQYTSISPPAAAVKPARRSLQTTPY
jgi:hypothetical protein